MNLQELAAKVGLSTEVVAKHLAPFRVSVEEVDWKTLEVPAQQERTLAAEDPALQNQMRKLRPQSLDDVRNWVGVPQRVFSRREIPGIGPAPAIRPSPTLTARIPSTLLHSISPTARLEDLAAPQKSALFGAAKNLVFGQVRGAELDTPLYRAAINLVLNRVLPIFFFPDILVGPGATLNIAPSVAIVLAYRIRVWRGGRIVTPKFSYVSFHCYSVEGGIV